ncbi:MAG: PepSY domain-containing protein, partial [Odoribacter sp.]|nr:PepSY domain-containing protein [Odoribacter sp.]
LMDPERTIGKKIVGISTLLFVFILITGLIIWLPKKIKGIGKRFKIHVKSGWRRFWVDLHLVGGVYALLFLLLMALTGLTWSFPWYRSAVNSLFGVTAVNTTQVNTHASGNHSTENTQQRADTTTVNNNEAQSQRGERSNRGNRENSEGGGQREGRGNRSGGEGRGQRGNRETEEEERKEVNYISWDKAIANLKEEHKHFKSMTIQDDIISINFSSLGNGRASDRYIFNPHGELVQHIPYKEHATKSARLHGWYFSLHVGSWGGLATKILSFVAALIGGTLPLTGYYMFIKKGIAKRKKKKLKKATI